MAREAPGLFLGGRPQHPQLHACLLSLVFLWSQASLAAAAGASVTEAACNCTCREGFSMEEAGWQMLSFFLSLVGCACAFVVGSMTNGQPLLYCTRKMSCNKVAKLEPLSSKSCNGNCIALPQVNGVAGNKLDKQPPGLSMMEQLVPEITHHVLSYLDFKSLCYMSMTNLAMRKAANDESAWKSLYHKDFNPEQSSTVPPNGWKAHYAVTKAVTEANKSFYSKLRSKSLRGMRQLWLPADYVKCIHPGGELISGYDAVMDNWRSVFSWSQRYDFELQDIKVRVMGDMAWVTSKAFVNASIEPLLSTNCYECHQRQWFVVHHHCSPQLDFAVPDYGMFG